MAESLTGKLLVASPLIVDPNFRRAVVLIAEHGDEGAMGLVLNRPAQTTVGEVVPELGWLAGDGEPVCIGGPVAPGAVIVVAEFADPARAAHVIDGDLGFVPAEIEDRDAFAADIRRARVFAGHAGWGAGQLEAEMEEDSWFVEPVRVADVFTGDPDALWGAVLRRKGRDYALIATMPLDPSLN